jgi:hypothetical protein
MRLVTTIFLLFLSSGLFAQTSWLTQPYNYEWKRGIFDSTLRIPVISSSRTFYTNKDSIGLIWFNPDSVKLFARMPGNIIKTFVTYDSIIVLKNNTIQNQNVASQSANYAIAGFGSAALSNIAKASSTGFITYLHFSHNSTDTSKKTWGIGLMGTPTDPGPGGDAGDSLKIRAYTTTGGILADLMTLSRTGPVYIPGQLTIGAVNGSSLKLLVNGGAVFNKDAVVTGFSNGSYLRETKIVTPTGDYTVLLTDLYVNVNNSANCTITLPLSSYGVYHIKKISNNAATVTIVGPNGTELIDGSTSYIMSLFNDHANIHQNDATNYYIY